MKTFLQSLVLFAWWCVLLFGSAGQLTWERAWTCTAFYLGGMYASRAVLRKLNPNILDQRQTAIRKDTKRFDKIFLRVFLSLTIIQPMIAGLDAVRFDWAPMPFRTVYLGNWSLHSLSELNHLRVSPKSPRRSSVRIQRDRDHTVVVSGPYRFVRHPMYVGLIFLHTSMALILGSTWNLALAGLIAMLLLWRTGLEDLTLRRELPGYERYTLITRYRLMPGTW
ncbi:MAG: methyltransferase family protein [Terriglobia bacterium]